MTFSLRYAARSDQGLVRGDNQDSAYAGPHLLALADGIGGQVGGARASSVVIETFAPLDAATVHHPAAALRDATESANQAIRDAIASDPDLDGMGTTLTALYFDGRELTLAHIGDSRGYRLAGGTFEQITRDDTLVQALVDAGRITAEEASVHPQRSMILRAMAGIDVEPATERFDARAGDRYLLCSDGLSDYVEHDVIAAATAVPDLERAVEEMISAALRAGAPDNVTCILAEVVEPAERTDTGADGSASGVLVGAAAERPGNPDRDDGATSPDPDRDDGAESAGPADNADAPTGQPDADEQIEGGARTDTPEQPEQDGAQPAGPASARKRRRWLFFGTRLIAMLPAHTAGRAR